MKDISRRKFLQMMGAGVSAVTALSLLSACKKKVEDTVGDNEYENQQEPPVGKMTYRINNKTKDKVSLLGYGMMRLPIVEDDKEEENEGPKEIVVDQEQLNMLVDYAMEHGVNYFDTSPAYTQGKSEGATGKALCRHKRSEYFVATKLSNFDPSTQSSEGSKQMYYNSMKELQVDYIDYYLLHAVGGSMEDFENRYVKNGMMDFLVEERKAGRIRNLGWSFHGEKEVFDYVLSLDSKYHWDFVQIQLNYLDWNYAHAMNDRNVNASYLLAELEKHHIMAVIMEPLLGGRLANVPQFVAKDMKTRRPEKSIASWAFRYAGTPESVLTVLSGMTYMEHLKDNLLSYSPLEPCNDSERDFLEKKIADNIYSMETIPCNDCKYCMPCPYGLDIPAIFVHYNKCKNEGTLPTNPENEEYRKLRRNYLIGYDRSVPKLRQASHCVSCHECEPHCPQKIRIAREMKKIDEFVEKLKQDV